jgi:DNA-binding protein YbaB
VHLRLRTVEVMFPEQPDFRTIAQDYQNLSVHHQRQADALGAAMASSTAVEEHPTFTLTMVGATHLQSLSFTDRAIESSPVQLRSAILESVARLGVASANGQARAIASILEAPEIGQRMRESVPDDVRARAEDESDDLPGRSASTGSGATPPERLDFDEVMAWAEGNAEPDVFVSDDLVEMMSDVEGWSPRHLGIDENQLLEDLQREVQALVAGARDLPQRIESIQAQESSKYLTVVANGVGRLVDVTFRPAFRHASADQLTEDFAELYAKACQAAQAQVFETIDGVADADDPTRALISAQQTSPRGQGE